MQCVTSLTVPHFPRKGVLCFALWAALATAHAADTDPTLAASLSDHFERATRYFAEGEPVSAVIELKNALQIRPDHVPSLVLIGEIYLDQGLGDAAEASFRRSLDHGADPSRVRVLLGRSLLAQRKSRELLEEVTADGLDPNAKAEIFALRAGAHLLFSNVDDAVRELEAAARVAPSVLSTRLVWTSVFIHRRQLDQADAYAERLLVDAPRVSGAWKAAGTVSHARGRFEEALTRYSRAVELDPRNGDARLARLSILIELARDDQSAEDLLYFAEHYPNEPRANYLRALKLARGGDELGARTELSRTTYFLSTFDDGVLQRQDVPLLVIGAMAHFGLGQFEQSIQYANQYLSLRPEDVTVRRLLGDALIRTGQFSDAIDTLQPALEESPDDPLLLSLAATAHGRAGDFEEASNLLERALQVRSSDVELRTRHAAMRISAGSIAEGIDVLTQLVDEDPARSSAGLALVISLLRKDEFANAAEVAQTLLTSHPDNPVIMNVLGVSHYLAGEYEQAEAQFQACLAASPGFLPAAINAGKTELALDRVDAALGRFRALAAANENNARIALELSRVEMATGNHREAVKHAERARRLANHDLDMLRHLVDLYLALGDLERAQQEATKGLAGVTDDLGELEIRARVLIARADYPAARVALRKLAKVAGFDAAWLVRTAAYQSSIGYPDDAAYSLYNATRSEPDNLAAHLGLIEQQLAQGLNEAALRSVSAALARFPQDASLQLLLGEAHFALGDPLAALAAFDKTLTLEPLSLAVVRGAHVHAVHGQPQKAETRMRTWLATHPADLTVRRSLAELLLGLRDFSNAVVEYEALLESFPDDNRVLNNLAFAMHNAGDDRAEKYARRAVAVAPDSAAANDTLGWILSANGNAAEALPYLREASTRAWNDAEIRYHLAVCLNELGRTDEALTELNAALGQRVGFEGMDAAERLHLELSRGATNQLQN